MKILIPVFLIVLLGVSCKKDPKTVSSFFLQAVKISNWPITRSDGSSWDVQSVLPDPFVVVKQGGTTVYTSGYITEPPSGPLVFGQGLPLNINAQLPTTIELWDYDGSSSDYMGGVTLNFSGIFESTKLVTISGASYDVEFTISQ